MLDKEIEQILLRDKEYDEEKIEELKHKIAECKRMIPLYEQYLMDAERSLADTIKALTHS